LCCPWGKLFRTDLIKKIELKFNESLHLGEDVVFVVTYLLNIKSLSLIKSSNYHYEIRPTSLVRTLAPFDKEYSVAQSFSVLFEPLKQQWISKFNSSEFSQENLCVWQLSMTERVVNAINNLPHRKERLNKLSKLDWTIYNKYKHSVSFKEALLVYLIKFRLFVFYDFLIRLRHLIR
jgi:hypothetical protein